MAASPPGQSMPAPSAGPEDPERGEHHADAELHACSRAPGSAGGARRARRAARRPRPRPAPSAARPTLCCAPPNVTTMNATSRPSRNTPLNATVNVYQSMPRVVAGGRASGALLLGVDRVLVVQRLEAARPQDRLPQPLQSEDRAGPRRRTVAGRRSAGRRARGRAPRRRSRSAASAAATPMIGRSPAPGDADGEHDRERLDHLDRAGQERRGDQQDVVGHAAIAECRVVFTTMPTEHDENTTESLAARLDRVTSPAERRVAEYLIEAGSKAAPMSAREIAAAVGTSDATVVRTAKSLGYASLRELRRALADEHERGRPVRPAAMPPSATAQRPRCARPAPSSAQLEALDTLLRRVSADDFDEAAAILAGATHVWWCGTGPSAHLAELRRVLVPAARHTVRLVHPRRHRSRRRAACAATSTMPSSCSPTDACIRTSECSSRTRRDVDAQVVLDHRHARPAVWPLPVAARLECRTWVARSVRHPRPDHRAARSTRARDGRRRPRSQPSFARHAQRSAPIHRRQDGSTSTPTDRSSDRPAINASHDMLTPRGHAARHPATGACRRVACGGRWVRRSGQGPPILVLGASGFFVPIVSLVIVLVLPRRLRR